MSQLLIPLYGAVATPLDSTTYYCGQFESASTTAENWNVRMPANGKITRVDISCTSPTTTGTNESFSIYIRLNNTTDYLVATVGAATKIRRFLNSDIHIHVTTDDVIEVKIITPAWATNPAPFYVYGFLTLDLGVSGVND